MKLFLSIVLFSFFTSVSGQSINVIVGQTDSIFSTKLNEYRKILVHIPQDKPDDFSPSQKYSVIYKFTRSFYFVVHFIANI